VGITTQNAKYKLSVTYTSTQQLSDKDANVCVVILNFDWSWANEFSLFFVTIYQSSPISVSHQNYDNHDLLLRQFRRTLKTHLYCGLLQCCNFVWRRV